MCWNNDGDYMIKDIKYLYTLYMCYSYYWDRQPDDKEDTHMLGADQLEAEEMEVTSEEESEIESDTENQR